MRASFALLSPCLIAAGLIGCGPGGSPYCAALGDEVLPDLPLYNGYDCGDGGWTDEVERLDDQLSVEVSRSSTVWTPLVRARTGGVVAWVGDELIGLDRAGNIEWRTPYAANQRLEHGTFAVGSDDRIYVSDSFGTDAKIVIFDGATGVQIRQFILNYDEFGLPPILAVRGEELWLSHVNSELGNEGWFTASTLARYSFEGELQSSVEVAHGEFEEPYALQWASDDTLVASGFRSVYTIDAASGEIGWQTAGSSQPEFIPRRALAVSGDSVVIANTVWSEGGGANQWLVTGYALASGDQQWSQSFAGSGGGDELGLLALPDGAVAFVAGEHRSPDQRQPMIVVFDAAGELLVGERLAIEGAATSAVRDSAGSMFVIGGTGTRESWRPEYERTYWLRRYDEVL